MLSKMTVPGGLQCNYSNNVDNYVHPDTKNQEEKF